MKTKIKVGGKKKYGVDSVVVEFPDVLKGCKAVISGIGYWDRKPAEGNRVSSTYKRNEYEFERTMKGTLCVLPINIPDGTPYYVGIKIPDDIWNKEYEKISKGVMITAGKTNIHPQFRNLSFKAK